MASGTWTHLRVDADVELREGRVAAALHRDRVEVHEHRHVPVAVVQILLKVARLAIVVVRLVLLAVDVLDQL